MKYQRIIAEFLRTPLAILPEKAAAISAFLRTKAAGGDVDPAEIQAIVAAKRADGVQIVGRVAVLPCMGVISQRVDMLQEASGGVSTERLGAALDSLLADKTVRCIVMAFDSPGGSVFGVDELATKIRQGRDQKKIVGIADSMAASAAYYLLSQCTEVNVTPGGMVGSIGVFTAHEDWSKFMEEEGVKTTLVSAGEYKVEANPFAPLTDEAREEMQRQVNHYYGQFLSAVAKGRGVSEAAVRKDFGQGRMALAQEAVDKRMADRVATFEQVLRRAGAYDGGTDNARARARLAEVSD